MENKIVTSLLNGRRVLWLICGGSNLPVAVKAMELAHREVTPDALKLLTIGQTDERYGAPGHVDSNWRQMLDMGFNFSGVDSYPMLTGKSLEATVSEYSEALGKLIARTKSDGGLVIAHCGIGSDGHVAGIMPGSAAVSDPRLVFGYEAGQYVRVTVTPAAFKQFDATYTFAFGAPKRSALLDLRDKDISMAEQPAQVLKSVPESYLYSDQY